MNKSLNSVSPLGSPSSREQFPTHPTMVTLPLSKPKLLVEDMEDILGENLNIYKDYKYWLYKIWLIYY